jgi:hypothetical protein
MHGNIQLEVLKGQSLEIHEDGKKNGSEMNDSRGRGLCTYVYVCMYVCMYMYQPARDSPFIGRHL